MTKIVLSKRELRLLAFFEQRCHSDDTVCPSVIINKSDLSDICFDIGDLIDEAIDSLGKNDEKAEITVGKNEINIILFMRDRCHRAKFPCPLHFNGNDAKFCHDVTSKLLELKKKLSGGNE